MVQACTGLSGLSGLVAAGVPTVLVANNATKPVLTFAGSSGTYDVQRSGSTPGSWTTVATGTASNPYTDSTAAAGTAYLYRARANGGPWSAPVWAVTKGQYVVNCQGYWAFSADGNDATANAGNMTLNGSPTFSGGKMVLNGSSQYATLAVSNGQPLDIHGVVSIEARFKLNNITDTQSIHWTQCANGPLLDLSFAAVHNTSIYLQYFDNAGTPNSVLRECNVSLSANVEYHVIGVIGSDHVPHIYLNGVLADGSLIGTPAARNAASATNATWGRAGNYNLQYLNGTLRDCALWNYDLSVGPTVTIPALYNQGTPVAYPFSGLYGSLPWNFANAMPFNANPIIPLGSFGTFYAGGVDSPYTGDAGFTTLDANGTLHSLPQVSPALGTPPTRSQGHFTTDATSLYTAWTPLGEAIHAGGSGTWNNDYFLHATYLKIGSTWYIFFSGANNAPGSATAEGVGVWTTTDWTTFTPSPNNPIICGTAHGAAFAVPSVVKVGTKYMMYGTDRGNPPAYAGVTSGQPSLGTCAKLVVYQCDVGADVTVGANWTGPTQVITDDSGDWDYGFDKYDVRVWTEGDGSLSMLYTSFANSLQYLGYAHCASGDGLTWTKSPISVLDIASAAGDAGQVGDPSILLVQSGGNTQLMLTYETTPTDPTLALAQMRVISR